MYKTVRQTRGLEFIDFYNNNNFHVVLSNYGASIYQIDVENENKELETITLSPSSISYYNNPKYFGLTVGRVAGRIENALIKVDNQSYKGKPNEGQNMLHGGSNNLSYRFYSFYVKDYDYYTKVTFQTIMNSLEDDFPGNLELNVIYRLYKNIDRIELEYQAISSEDTLLNLTNHSYFNLSGNLKRTILDHELTINKDEYSTFNEGLIIKSFEKVNDKFDFRKGMVIGKHIKDNEVLKYTSGYDHYFSGNGQLKLRLHDKISKRSLYIESDYEDCVIYTNNQESKTVFSCGKTDIKNIGIAIEPSRFSKTVNSTNGLLLKANELYNYSIAYEYKEEE